MSFDWGKYKEVAPSKSEPSFDWSKYETKEQSGAESLARNAMQAAIGAGKGALYTSPAGAPAAIAELSIPAAKQNIISELLESDIEHQQMYPGEFPQLTRAGLEQGAKQAEEKILGKGGLVEGAVSAPFRAAGIDTEAKSGSERAIKGISELFSLFKSGKLSVENAKKALGAALTGEATKETAEQLGIPEPVANLLGIGTGALTRDLKPSVKVENKFSSGLTKPKAVEAKVPERGRLTKAQKQKTINKLTEEADQLFKGKIKEHVPLKEKIDSGYDFSSEYEKRFGRLRNLAKNADPEIDITNLNKYMRDSLEEFRGIPKLDKEAAAIDKEVNAFRRNPKDSLRDLLNIYRSNNRTLKLKYERAKTHGTEQMYVKFLEGMNKKITQAIEETLPENSAWVKEFKDLNKEYSQYRKSLKALQELKPVLEEGPTPKNIGQLANNLAKQRKLSLAIGKEQSEEIVQIAKDLNRAVKAIKRIPVKDWSKWEIALPFSFLFPVHGGAAGTLAAAYKGYDVAKRAYGLILTSPAKRKIYQQAITALENQDLKAYIAATEKLAKSLESETD